MAEGRLNVELDIQVGGGLGMAGGGRESEA